MFLSKLVLPKSDPPKLLPCSMIFRSSLNETMRKREADISNAPKDEDHPNVREMRRRLVTMIEEAAECNFIWPRTLKAIHTVCVKDPGLHSQKIDTITFVSFVTLILHIHKLKNKAQSLETCMALCKAPCNDFCTMHGPSSIPSALTRATILNTLCIINHKWHSKCGGRSPRQCHQMSHREGRGLVKVSRDILCLKIYLKRPLKAMFFC